MNRILYKADLQGRSSLGKDLKCMQPLCMDQKYGYGIQHNSQGCKLWKRAIWEGHVEWQDGLERTMKACMQAAVWRSLALVWPYWEDEEWGVCEKNYVRGRPLQRWKVRVKEHMSERGARRVRKLKSALSKCSESERYKLYCHGHPKGREGGMHHTHRNIAGYKLS